MEKKLPKIDSSVQVRRNQARNIYFEKAFSELSHQEQKEQFSEHASTALQTIISRLKKKKLAYNLDQMLEDFTLILEEWKKKPMA